MKDAYPFIVHDVTKATRNRYVARDIPFPGRCRVIRRLDGHCCRLNLWLLSVRRMSQRSVLRLIVRDASRSAGPCQTPGPDCCGAGWSRGPTCRAGSRDVIAKNLQVCTPRNRVGRQKIAGMNSYLQIFGVSGSWGSAYLQCFGAGAVSHSAYLQYFGFSSPFSCTEFIPAFFWRIAGCDWRDWRPIRPNVSCATGSMPFPGNPRGSLPALIGAAGGRRPGVARPEYDTPGWCGF